MMARSGKLSVSWFLVVASFWIIEDPATSASHSIDRTWRLTFEVSQISLETLPSPGIAASPWISLWLPPQNEGPHQNIIEQFDNPGIAHCTSCRSMYSSVLHFCQTSAMMLFSISDTFCLSMFSMFSGRPACSMPIVKAQSLTPHGFSDYSFYRQLPEKLGNKRNFPPFNMDGYFRAFKVWKDLSIYSACHKKRNTQQAAFNQWTAGIDYTST